jgi:hypothetical protein
MNARIAIAGLLITKLALIGFSQETAPTAPATSDGKVTLHDGKDIPLSDNAAQTLRSKALKLLESSNFNSSVAKWRELWGTAKIQNAYRKAVAGKFLLLTFDQPQKMNTTGGDVTVTEIVVSLNGSDNPSELFTIDNENRVVMHVKYSGLLSVDLLDFVKSIAK